MLQSKVVPVAPCRILVIHADDVLQSSLRRAASEAGHAVTAIASLARGVALAARLRPDIIALDLGLRDPSGRDGRDVLSELRQHPDTEKIPVLAFTTQPELHAQLALELGAEAVFSPPVDANQVVSKIERVVLRTSSGSFPVTDELNDEF